MTDSLLLWRGGVMRAWQIIQTLSVVQVMGPVKD